MYKLVTNAWIRVFLLKVNSDPAFNNVIFGSERTPVCAFYNVIWVPKGLPYVHTLFHTFVI